MNPARVVGVVFKDGQIHLLEAEAAPFLLPLEELAGSLVVTVVESKGPDYKVKVVPLPKNIDDSLVELLVFQLPNYESQVEGVPVKNVLSLQVGVYFLIASWPQDVRQGFLLSYRLGFHHLDFWQWSSLGDDCPVFAGVGRIDLVLSLRGEVEFPLKSLGWVRLHLNVADLGLLVTLQGNWPVRNILKKLDLEYWSRDVGDDCLQNIGLEDQEMLDFFLALSSFLINEVRVAWVEEPLIQDYALGLCVGKRLHFPRKSQERWSSLYYVAVLAVWELVVRLKLRGKHRTSQDEISLLRERPEFITEKVLAWGWGIVPGQLCPEERSSAESGALVLASYTFIGSVSILSGLLSFLEPRLVLILSFPHHVFCQVWVHCIWASFLAALIHYLTLFVVPHKISALIHGKPCPWWRWRGHIVHWSAKQSSPTSDIWRLRCRGRRRRGRGRGLFLAFLGIQNGLKKFFKLLAWLPLIFQLQFHCVSETVSLFLHF